MTKKLLLVASYAPSLISFRFHFIKALSAAGYEVVACAPVDEDADLDEVIRLLANINVKFVGIKMKRTGLNPVNDLFTIYSLAAVMRKYKISTVFSYTMKPIIYASLAAKIIGNIKIYSLITGTGYIFLAEGFKSKMLRKLTTLLLRVSMKFNNRIFFQNIDNLNEFRSYGIINNHQKTGLINGSGVCTEEFAPSLYPAQLSFLLIARLLVNKGIREYAAAAEIIKKKFPHIKFMLVGWIDDNPGSITEQELNLWINSSVIDYLGRLKDVRPAIAQSSVYVLPSYGEGTPRSVLEAMAMSRPIITTDVPGCRETVVHGKNGFLIQQKDEHALANAMLKFIQEPNLIPIMGKESRQIAIDKYDVNKVNQTILNFMEDK